MRKILAVFLFLTLSSIILLNFNGWRVYQFKKNSELKISNMEKLILPKVCEDRVWEINLSKNIIYFFENCELKSMMKIAHQSRPGKWYQTPTGYFRLGTKRERHVSSYFNVRMDYAVQLYEDYFIHENPRFLNGRYVTRNFSAGCLSLETDYAKKFYSLAKTGDLVISYLDLDHIQLNDGFFFPVNRQQFYVKQRFNNPLRTRWLYVGNKDNLTYDFIQHSGVDLAPNPNVQDLNVYSIYDGKIARIIKNGQNDYGMGNTVIIEHQINNRAIYSLYAHLSSIRSDLKEGNVIKGGEVVGRVGATGFGCDYWRIERDGCQEKDKLDIHLHWEIKTKPVLSSPKPAQCFINGKQDKCYGYTPDDPINYGYFNPLDILAKK
ncbi:MAG: peptidoglycan DD-metalloendopeptidase family protein [Patescibacteria group bacterium]|nr:peptidoglycan DD-metalloendopeptidase family protein [Patescibacteria group bacterium]